jgi:hypothetical protein
MKNYIVVTLLLAVATQLVFAAEISGIPRVVDGDTVEIGHQIRTFIIRMHAAQ